MLSKKVVFLDTGTAAGAGSGLSALESSLPIQDAFLPVGRERDAGDFEAAMCGAKEALAVEIVGDGGTRSASGLLPARRWVIKPGAQGGRPATELLTEASAALGGPTPG